MSHQRSGFKLGREKGQRTALLKTLAGSVLRRGKIKTTVFKAKAAKPLIERLITMGKKGTLAAKRDIISKTGNPALARLVFETISPKYKERQGGYVRITKLGRRKSDGAEMAYIELV